MPQQKEGSAPAGAIQISEADINRFYALPRVLKVLLVAITICGLALAVVYLFHLPLPGRYVLIDFAYYYLFIALFFSSLFLIIPARKKDKKLRWYDLLAFITTFCICFYFFINAKNISTANWINIPMGIILMLLILEGGRRAGGFIYLVVCIMLGSYPLFAGHMPGLLLGASYSLKQTLSILVFRMEGLMGMPIKVTALILVGFLVFASVMIASGAGEFFIKLAVSMLGTHRGGPAKVSALASGLFGSLSGSILSNVAGTGAFTIPMMKRTGYPAHYAGAVEAVASTGGAFMPPVMGSTAFILCELTGIEYRVVMIAAALPAILYYFGLLMQIDAYAAKHGLKGLPREELPSVRKTLLEGWPFIFVFLFLIWGLAVMRWEYMAPWYASGMMVLLSFYRRETWMTPRRIVNTLVQISRLIIQTLGVLLPISFIIAGLTVTGATGAFTAGILSIGGDNPYLILLMGMVACYIMGMAGMSTVAYIFLAVTMAPAVIRIGGFNVLSTHLLIMYYDNLSVFTPPVAIAAFFAATMAQANPMKTAWTAMRLGVVIYFIPLFFIFNPAIVLQSGTPFDQFYLFVFCLLGIALLAAGMEGYLLKVGRVDSWARPMLVFGGLLLAFPEWKTTVAGISLASLAIAIMLIRKRRNIPQKLQLVK